MITASQLAGFCAAHALWSLFEDSRFIPFYAYTTDDNERKMERIVSSDPGNAVTLGRTMLKANEGDANDGVLLYDARVPTDTGKIDAIIIEMRVYVMPGSEAIIAVPYTPKTAGKFLVHRPQLLHWKDCEDFNKDWALEAFFAGVDEHSEGSKIWKACLDASK